MTNIKVLKYNSCKICIKEHSFIFYFLLFFHKKRVFQIQQLISKFSICRTKIFAMRRREFLFYKTVPFCIIRSNNYQVVTDSAIQKPRRKRTAVVGLSAATNRSVGKQIAGANSRNAHVGEKFERIALRAISRYKISLALSCPSHASISIHTHVYALDLQGFLIYFVVAGSTSNSTH